VYRALLYDSSNTILEKWDDRRTDDSSSGKFTITTSPDKLKGCVLYWEAEVSDPRDAGGLYVCTIRVEQDESVVCLDAISGIVKSGSGQRDPIGNHVVFT
jgi:hypothetical protein